MGKILVLVLLATAAVSLASRDVHSPGGWQTNVGFNGGSSSGFTRSSGNSWVGSRGELGRSANNGGWRETPNFESSSRSGNRNRDPSSNGWSQSGYSSNGAYGGNSFRYSPGWNDRFSDSTMIESLDSSNSWNEPSPGFRSSNGWQSSGW